MSNNSNSVRDQINNAEVALQASENDVCRSDEMGNFPNKFEALRDLVSNLMHYAEHNKVDFISVLQSAQYHYKCEGGEFYYKADSITGPFDEVIRKAERQ